MPRPQVLRIAGVTHDTNVFTLDAGAAERRLERDPWIADATVTKDLPSTLVIDLHERIAVAVAESDGVLRLVADDGAFLETARPRVAIGMPSIVIADAEGMEPSPEAVGGAARAIAAMAPTLRRRIDGISILADGQLRVDLSSRVERGVRRSGRAPGESDGAPQRCWTTRRSVGRPSSPWTSGCRRPRRRCSRAVKWSRP